MKSLCVREQQILQHFCFWGLNVWTSWILTSFYKQECEYEQNQFFFLFSLFWEIQREQPRGLYICASKEKKSLQKSLHIRSALPSVILLLMLHSFKNSLSLPIPTMNFPCLPKSSLPLTHLHSASDFELVIWAYGLSKDGCSLRRYFMKWDF